LDGHVDPHESASDLRAREARPQRRPAELCGPWPGHPALRDQDPDPNVPTPELCHRMSEPVPESPSEPSAGGSQAARRARRKQERGVALILVLGALTILTVMLTDFQDETSSELGSALSARDALKA